MIQQAAIWLAKSFGDSREVSARRLTAFAVTSIYVSTRAWYVHIITDPYYLLMGNVVDVLFILLLFGIVTFQQIIELKNGPKADAPVSN